MPAAEYRPKLTMSRMLPGALAGSSSSRRGILASLGGSCLASVF